MSPGNPYKLCCDANMVSHFRPANHRADITGQCMVKCLEHVRLLFPLLIILA